MKLRLERHLSTGHHLTVVLESADIPTHGALEHLKADGGVNLAMVNVLDVAEESLRALRLIPATPRSDFKRLDQ